MDMGLVVIIAIVAIIIGMFIGFLLSKATTKMEQSGNIKNQMDSLQERFVSYQQEVINHFNTTATLANRISEDHQSMQNHLIQSIESLVTDDDLRTQLLLSIKNPTKTLDYVSDPIVIDTEENITTTDNSPTAYSDIPKDYAPKVPGQVGTLTEEFGAKHLK